jgi:hypothetical protein
MSWKDPTTWWSCGLAIATVAAILPWRYDGELRWASWQFTLTYAAIAVFIVAINWWAGGLWAVNLTAFDNPTRIENFRPYTASSSGVPRPQIVGSSGKLAVVAVLGLIASGVVAFLI